MMGGKYRPSNVVAGSDRDTQQPDLLMLAYRLPAQAASLFPN